MMKDNVIKDKKEFVVWVFLNTLSDLVKGNSIEKIKKRYEFEKWKKFTYIGAKNCSDSELWSAVITDN